MSFHSLANKTHFHFKGFVLDLSLKRRQRETRKWPIGQLLAAWKQGLYKRYLMNTIMKLNIICEKPKMPWKLLASPLVTLTSTSELTHIHFIRTYPCIRINVSAIGNYKIMNFFPKSWLIAKIVNFFQDRKFFPTSWTIAKILNFFQNRKYFPKSLIFSKIAN